MVFANKLRIKRLQKKKKENNSAIINIVHDDILYAHTYKVFIIKNCDDIYDVKCSP